MLSENTYLVDLEITLIELFNQETRYYYDQIQDGELDKFIEHEDDLLIDAQEQYQCPEESDDEDNDFDEVVFSDDDVEYE